MLGIPPVPLASASRSQGCAKLTMSVVALRACDLDRHAGPMAPNGQFLKRRETDKEAAGGWVANEPGRARRATLGRFRPPISTRTRRPSWPSCRSRGS